MEVAEEEDEAESDLLKRMAGKDDTKGEPKKKDVAMDQAGDSYAECFESFEGYNLELHGPDSDDETTSSAPRRRDDPSRRGRRGGKGKKRRGVDREKAEELKREAAEPRAGRGREADGGEKEEERPRTPGWATTAAAVETWCRKMKCFECGEVMMIFINGSDHHEPGRGAEVRGWGLLERGSSPGGSWIVSRGVPTPLGPH